MRVKIIGGNISGVGDGGNLRITKIDQNSCAIVGDNVFLFFSLLCIRFRFRFCLHQLAVLHLANGIQKLTT